MTRLERVNPDHVRYIDGVYRWAIISGQPDGIKPEIKQHNFVQLLKIAGFCGVSLAGASVLDVGCGTGDDFPRWTEAGASYHGVDISSHALSEARLKYPNGDFVKEDIIAAAASETFDLVVASGVMNLRLRDPDNPAGNPEDNYDFLESVVGAMWQRARRGVAFNFYPDTNEVQPKNLFFYHEDRVRDICTAITGPTSLVFLSPTNTYSTGEAALTQKTTVYIVRNGIQSISTPVFQAE